LLFIVQKNSLIVSRYRFFPDEQTGISGFGTAPIPRQRPGTADENANRGRQAFGGHGHILGNQ